MAELNLVLLGPPGSGKGTQGERLNADLRLPYYATGDILRGAVRTKPRSGKSAKAYMDRGDLVPDEVIVGVIAERIDSEEARDGFILDGFPRTTPQAEALDAKLAELGRAVTAVLLIDVGDDEVVRRLGGRRTCEAERPRLPRRLQPAEGRGRLRHRRLAADRPRRRQARRDPQAARDLPREDRAAGLLLRRPRRAAPGRRRARARRGHRGHARHPRDDAPERPTTLSNVYRMIIRKTPEQVDQMAAAGDILVRTPEDPQSEGAAGRHDAGTRRSGGEVHPLAGRGALVQGLPRLPRIDLRLAQLDGRPRHPRRLRVQARRRALDRRRRHQGRLGRRRRGDGADRADLDRGQEPARGDQELALRRDRADGRRQPPRRRLQRDPALGRVRTGSR